MIYGEGLHIGYRHYDRAGVAPLFPFGHGLSYTTFEYGRPSLSGRVLSADGAPIELVVAVSNVGDVKGWETVQVYVRDEKSRLPRPEKELVAFEKVELESGETKHLRVGLDKYAVGYFDTALGRWVAEEGVFRVLVAASAGDVKYVLLFLLVVGPRSLVRLGGLGGGDDVRVALLTWCFAVTGTMCHSRSRSRSRGCFKGDGRVPSRLVHQRGGGGGEGGAAVEGWHLQTFWFLLVHTFPRHSRVGVSCASELGGCARFPFRLRLLFLGFDRHDEVAWLIHTTTTLHFLMLSQSLNSSGRPASASYMWPCYVTPCRCPTWPLQ